LKIRKTLNNRTENMPRREKKPAALGLTVEGACSVLNAQAKQGSDDDDERKRKRNRFLFLFLFLLFWFRSSRLSSPPD
jgi:hypothetical protein